VRLGAATPGGQPSAAQFRAVRRAISSATSGGGRGLGPGAMLDGGGRSRGFLENFRCANSKTIVLASSKPFRRVGWPGQRITWLGPARRAGPPAAVSGDRRLRRRLRHASTFRFVYGKWGDSPAEIIDEFGNVRCSPKHRNTESSLRCPQIHVKGAVANPSERANDSAGS
jgi:hypothetical protein